MSQALRTKPITREAFLDWAEAQNERHEFDGVQPVAMVVGSRNHSQICQNLYFALRTRLRGTACTPLGPDAGIATIGVTIRRYAQIDSRLPAVSLLSRNPGATDWIETTLGPNATIPLPEIGIDIPIADLYAETDLP